MALNAQIFFYGLYPGIAYTTAAVNENTGNVDVTTSGSCIGYHIGLLLRVDLKNFYLEGNALFTCNASGIVNVMDVRASYLGAPLMLGKKFYPGFMIFTGLDPNIILIVNGNGFWDDDIFSLKIIGGAGLYISKLTLSLRYER